MDEFENAIKKASDIFYGVVRKSGEFVENTKASYNINLEKDKIVKLQSKMGAKIYSMHKNGEEVPEVFLEDLRAISEIEENISKLEKNFAENKAYIICPECSAKLNANSVYCPKCGAKQNSAENSTDDKNS